VKGHLLRSLQTKIKSIDANRFGDSRPGASEEKEQGVIPAATTCPFVRCLQERFQIALVEMPRGTRDGPLVRDRQDPLCDTDGGRIASCDMTKKGSDGGQPSIPRADVYGKNSITPIMKSDL
jgi:hypothetical protein